ncbi:disease resistance protein RPM1-like [Primulina huaijiensis]|uniref:disease resistance protein RPM1-like n=1 Tax=Primulina huaijiensis TaxID=1492673 RepID=UPI003CC71AA1
MAELAISAAVSILIELAVPKILEKLNVDEDMGKEIDSMGNLLEKMKAYVEANGDHRETDGMLEVKVKQIREIAFEIEDVLDEIVIHTTINVFHSHKFTQRARKFGHNIRHGFPLRKISEKIANIKRKFEDIKSQAKAFPDDSSSSNSASGSGLRTGHRVSPLLLDDEMVGYTNLKETFMSLLTDGEESLVTLAVVGPPGSGKTTFLKNMFWNTRIRRRFDCHAWVHVSKDQFDLKALYINMLKQFCDWRKESYHTLDISEALAQIRKYLEKKRYIVVLDDIWQKEHCDRIKDALPKGLLGSRIIVSMRDSNIASSCASSPQFVYELKGLEWLDAWSLFCKTAFKDNNGECPSELKTCSSEIVTRCERLPFAILAVAGALAQKEKLPSEWEKFHKGLGCEIGSELSAIRNTLLPGYLDLSSNLKSCFLYFGLFPEDYSVERGRLIRLWVAERFVTETDSKTAEEVAEDYLAELIHRNLVHVSNWDFDGRPRSCRVLSLLLTFIVQKCKEEIFASISRRENTSATHVTRRLSIHGDCSHLQEISIKFAVIRSVFLFRCDTFLADHLGNNFRDFELLRVLDLQGAPLTEFPEQITRLILLRYLSLRGTNIMTIPDSIKKLFYLKTLDLRQTSVTQLPKAISRLCHLRHLFVYKYNVDNYVAFDSVQGVKIFEGIGNLKNLQKLSLVEVGEKDGIIRELEKLTQLRKLGLVGIRREHGKSLCASLERLKTLTTLDLCSKTKEEFLEVGEIQNPNSNIQRLYLKGRLKEFPRWISKLDNLQRIGLKWSKSKDCPLKALKDLPNLKEIKLIDSFEGEELVFEASTFKKLKILVIEKFSLLNTLVIEQGAMPELQKMNLHQCPNLKMLPLGIDKLSKIEELVLRDMAEEFIATLRHNSEDRQMVEHIPVIKSFTRSNQGWTPENLSGSFSA